MPLESLEPLPDQEQQKLVSNHGESEKDQETSSLRTKCYSECPMAASCPSLQHSSTSILPPSLPPSLLQVLFKFACG